MPNNFLLQQLADKQKGGAEAIKGFIYQVQFTTFQLLREFSDNNLSSKTFHLEGVEDLDYYFNDNNTHFQVKCYDNGIKTEQFKDILFNFWKTYEQVKQSKFVLIYNAFLDKGKLQELSKGTLNTDYWKPIIEKKYGNIELNDVSNFLTQISFEKHTENNLERDIQKLLIDKYNILKGNEVQFLNALFLNVLFWSRQRRQITYQEFITVIENVRINISKGIINLAEKDKWIEIVSFNNPYQKDFAEAYFEGKAAKPYHIGLELPISRMRWENSIQENIQNFDVTVIQASSGQGKSTLAWQVAYKLKSLYTVYELHYCQSQNHIGDLKDVILSRLRIGQLPLIVIDGLNNNVQAWSELAQRTQDLPVKYLVTTRQEDWFRFSLNVSALNLKNIDLNLDYDEADKIYKAFAKRGKLAANISKENAWENIKQKGLLIEYIYLITKGKMIKERLEEQICSIQNEVDGVEKLEILRLIATADVLGVKLYTETLIQFIKTEIGFKKDKNSTITSLQKEYQIQFDNNAKIEGLHPVRSQHLVDILHNGLPIITTLKNLLEVIDTSQLFTFISQVPLLLTSQEETKNFLTYITSKITDKSYIDIVEIINGIYATDARLHWQKNKEQYDFLYDGKGGAIYAMDIMPFSNPIFKPLSENNIDRTDISEEQRENAKQILAVYDKFYTPNVQELSIAWFIKSIHKQLYKRTFGFEIKSLAHLAMWQHRYNLECPILKQIDTEKMYYLLQNEFFEELGELFFAIFTIYPKNYLDFYTIYGTLLLMKLKAELSIVKIEIIDNEVNLEYFVDENEKITNINNQSVNKLELTRYFIPQFQKYHSKGIYIPIPFLQEFRVVDESIKHLQHENMVNKFVVKGNQIWLSKIEEPYTFASIYDFQKYYFDLREISLKLLNGIKKFFYFAIQPNQNGIKSLNLDTQIEITRELIKIHKNTPYDNNFSEKIFGSKIKALTKWQNNLDYVIRQLFPKDDDMWRLVNYNSQELLHSLESMQNSYEDILNQTQRYFDTSVLIKQEFDIYSDFVETIEYYYFNRKNNTLKSCTNAKKEITNWFQEQETIRLSQVQNILNKIQNPKYDFVLPSCSWRNELSREITVGFIETGFHRVYDADELLLSLIPLANTDIDKFYFVYVKDNKINSMDFAGFSVSKGLLEVLYDSQIQNIKPELGYHRVIPIQVTKDILKSLPNVLLTEIKKSKQDHSPIVYMLTALWQYCELKKHLSKEDLEFPKWKDYIDNLVKKAKDNLAIIAPEFKKTYSSIFELVLYGNTEMDAELFRGLLYRDLFSEIFEK
jgi:hypothetical protein